MASSPVPPKLDLADVHSQHLFHMPSTTSASSSLYRTISTTTRKRSRIDHPEKPRRLYDFSADDADDDLYRFSGRGRRDDVAGVKDDIHSETCGQLPLAPPIDASLDSLTPTENSGNSRKRTRRETWYNTAERQPENGVLEEKGLCRSEPESVGWGRSVLNVVEKMWNFCWSGAFRGFYAGGGRGYHMPPGSKPQPDEMPPSQHMPIDRCVTSADTPQASSYHFTRRDSSIPGQFPDENEIQQNWVVVPQTDGPADYRPLGLESSDFSTSAKRVHRFSGTPGLAHSRSSRPSAVPRLSKKVSLNKPSTPTRIPVLSPSGRNARESPVSAETQRYVSQMRLMEREEDASLRRFNLQLQMMIKEGQQALGTQVDMDDLDMDNYS